jgi:cell shape-determining protein MreC
MMQKLAEFDEILVKVASMYEENKQLRIPEQLADAEYSD